MGNAIQYGIYRNILACLFVVIGLSVFGQETAELSSDKKIAWYQITELKESGAVIVRLKQNERKLAAYTNAGYIEKAAELRAEQDERNSEIMQSFIEYFSFCPVYFIEASDYAMVLNDVGSGVFLNEKLEKDSTIVLEEEFFFFCDHGSVYEQVLADQNDANTKYMTSTPVLQDAYVLKDKEVKQLLDPFPFFVPVRIKGYDNAAEKLSNQLRDYYAKILYKQGND